MTEDHPVVEAHLMTMMTLRIEKATTITKKEETRPQQNKEPPLHPQEDGGRIYDEDRALEIHGLMKALQNQPQYSGSLDKYLDTSIVVFQTMERMRQISQHRCCKLFF